MENGFDGLELDWEFPVCWQMDCSAGPASDRQGYSSLVRELGTAMRRAGLILSAVVSASPSVIDKAYDVTVLSDNLDFVTVMTYDYHGHWEKQTGHISPLYDPQPESMSVVRCLHTRLRTTFFLLIEPASA